MTAWRTIFTDSESLTGVAPVCPEQRTSDGLHMRRDYDGDTQAWWDVYHVFDCCPHPHIETWSEATAAVLAETLTAAEAQVCS